MSDTFRPRGPAPVDPPSGRHEGDRPSRPRPARIALLAALAVLVPLATFGVVATRRGPASPGCPAADARGGNARLVTVQADPRIAPVVTSVLRDIGPGDECVQVQVDQRSSSDLAYDLAQPATAELSIPTPDVWIPDSSAWFAGVRSTAAGVLRLTSVTADPVVTSPVVAAVRRDTARSLGWPERQTSWDALVTAQGGGLRVALGDVQSDAAALLALLADGRGLGDLTPDLLRLTRQVVLPKVGDLRGKSPTAAVGSGIFDAIGVAEQDVLAHNRVEPEHPVVADYASRAAPSLDFPFAPLADAATGLIDPGKQRADEIVRARLSSAQARAAFAAAGFRTTGGKLSEAFGTAQGVVPGFVPDLVAPAGASVERLQQRWPALRRRGRVLVVVDESGSMADPLPGSSLTKMQLAKQALGAVVKEVAPDSDMGLWTFTSSRRQDYQVRVPLGRVNDGLGRRPRRAALADAVDGLSPVPTGGTGLYDTTLAAFRAASRDYDFGRLNAILVFTDGRNEDDPGSVSRGRLLRSIRQEFKSGSPVRILTFAYGKDADTATLSLMSDATGATAYRTVRAEQVVPLLTDALGKL